MLSVRDHMVLQLTAKHYKYPTAREDVALWDLGYTSTRFWQRVNWLIDQPAALEAYPMEVRRLQRLRDLRQRARSA